MLLYLKLLLSALMLFVQEIISVGKILVLVSPQFCLCLGALCFISCTLSGGVGAGISCCLYTFLQEELKQNIFIMSNIFWYVDYLAPLRLGRSCSILVFRVIMLRSRCAVAEVEQGDYGDGDGHQQEGDTVLLLHREVTLPCWQISSNIYISTCWTRCDAI